MCLDMVQCITQVSSLYMTASQRLSTKEMTGNHDNPSKDELH